MLESFWQALDPKDPLFPYRKKGWDLFQSIGLPRPKEEAFQYVRKEFVFPKPSQEKKISLSRGSSQRIVFIDGFLDESLSAISAPSSLLSIQEATLKYGLFLESRLKKIFKEEKDPFAALNSAFFGRGAFLYVPPNTQLDVDLLHIYTEPAMTSAKLHIYVGRNSQLHVHTTSEGTKGFVNGFLDLVLDQGAQCTFKDESEGDFQAIRASLKRDSFFKLLLLGRHIRNSVRIDLTEENCEANFLSLLSLKGKEESHIHAHVEHQAPHTRSRQHVKSVLTDHSRFSFEGKIFVHPEAQKTEAYQLNNNLILSDEAAANAKPNLEIFADDVKASHGATTGKLDEEELFYLRSRGLLEEEAKKWLIQGFCKEILDHA